MVNYELGFFPSVPISGKPTQIRMGKGKGFVQYWAAKISIGMVLFEISNVSNIIALNALRSGVNKLPVKCGIISKKTIINILIIILAVITQLVRVLDCGSKSYGFKSR